MRNIQIIVFSCVATSIVGSACILGYWGLNHELARGVPRTAVYLFLVGGAHLLVWRFAPALEKPGERQARTPPGGAGPALGYRPAVWLALVQQVSLLALASLMLDGGYALRVCVIAVLAHWGLVLLIILRRPAEPSRIDLSAIRFGLWVILIVAGTAASWLGRLAHAS